MTNYKSGTVAKVTHERTGKTFLAIRGKGTVPEVDAGWFSAEMGFNGDDMISDVHPLVVLDLDSHKSSRHYNFPAHLRGLVEADPRPSFNGGPQRDFALWIADQIEEQTKPARIPEPGLWGIVDDACGYTYVHTSKGVWRSTTDGIGRKWEDINNPVLVREGVDV